ncbi:transposable element Tcb1 transposase [Trichonephila clavipes]|nr:transposable element Tcb1 transposase [Trichonephila clavipes]
MKIKDRNEGNVVNCSSWFHEECVELQNGTLSIVMSVAYDTRSEDNGGNSTLQHIPRYGEKLPSDVVFYPSLIRVGRNQSTVIRICDRWMQECTTDQRGPSHPPQCTISREERKVVCLAVTDRSITSRTTAQHIESATHHSVSAHTIRRRLQQSGLSARRPLLGLPLKQNYRRLHHQWWD